MKLVVVSDTHGRPLSQLEDVLKAEKPDLVATLGDHDQVDTIRELSGLATRWQTISVAGNHEHAIYHGNKITSNTFKTQGKSFGRLVRELHSDPAVRAYVEKMIKNSKIKLYLDEERFGTQFPAIFMHAALDGDLGRDAERLKPVAMFWHRLRRTDDHVRNFAAMEMHGYRVMFRGHDANPSYASRDPITGVSVLNGTYSYELLPNRLHTITVGDYFRGHFAVVDTRARGYKNPIVSLKRL